MADEAVVRIVLQDDGGNKSATVSSSAEQPQVPPAQSYTPPQPQATPAFDVTPPQPQTIPYIEEITRAVEDKQEASIAVIDTVMSQAHVLAKEIRGQFDTYSEAFTVALQTIWDETKQSAEAIVEEAKAATVEVEKPQPESYENKVNMRGPRRYGPSLHPDSPDLIHGGNAPARDESTGMPAWATPFTPTEPELPLQNVGPAWESTPEPIVPINNTPDYELKAPELDDVFKERRAGLEEWYAQQEQAIVEIAETEPLFDPMEEARKRRERERQKALIDDAYKQQYGGDESESFLTQTLKIAGEFRGTIGGFGGTIIGAALDLMASFQKAEVQAKEKKHKEQLLAEAKAATPIDAKAAAQGATDIATKFNKSGQEWTDKLPGKSQIPGKLPVGNTTSAAANVATGAGAAAEGGMAGMLGGAGGMAAAGPIGAVVAVVVATLGALNNAVKGAVSAVGGFAIAVADSSAHPSVAIGGLGDAATAAGDKLIYITPIIGLAASAFGESAKALSGFMQAIDKTIERYAEFSPEIAQSQAIAEIRQTMGDFRRAQEISNEMAQYTIAQADLQQKIEDIKIKILTKILPIATRILEVLEAILPSGEGIEAAIAVLSAPLTMLSTLAGELVGMQRDDRLPEVQDPTTLLNDARFEQTAPDGQVVRNWAPDR